jgi:hypothetical protein
MIIDGTEVSSEVGIFFAEKLCGFFSLKKKCIVQISSSLGRKVCTLLLFVNYYYFIFVYIKGLSHEINQDECIVFKAASRSHRIMCIINVPPS